MQIGMMNNPARSLESQVRFAARHTFDYLDLTVEPPEYDSANLDPGEVKRIIHRAGLGIVGHTAWYLPFDSPITRIRRAASAQFIADFEFFAEIEVTKATIHFFPTSSTRIFTHRQRLGFILETLQPVVKRSRELGIDIMLENCVMNSRILRLMRAVFEHLPEIHFHLDIGHAFLNGQTTLLDKLLQHFGHKLIHLHASDNVLGDDLHLPLGAGQIPWPGVIRKLKQIGYDDTLTLEIFSHQRTYLTTSARLWRQWWG